MRFLLSAFALALPLSAIAAPTNTTAPPESVIEDAKQLKVGSVSPLSSAEVDSYVPYGWFSAAAYCPPETRNNWQCKSCQADSIKDFQVYKSGGDGGVVQYWYVGWWPSQNSVVVGRQGTDTDKIEAILTDAAFLPVGLSSAQFPGRPLLATAHVGFLASHTRSAADILSAVKDVLAQRNTTKILVVGQSLGAALVTLDGLYLQLQLGSKVQVSIRGLGGPRVGNDVFADFVNAKVSDVIRITNKRDIVPVLPPLLLGFKHTTGEKHINIDGVWNSCAGQDNLSPNCSAGEVLTKGVKLEDHLGPYAGGVVIGQTGC
ncbi:Lipase (class 3) [Rhizoctonia solani]|uniref:Lipase (Class 3) n=1 Tax=Rhizoctonia solani TaxID=456999 RepID=A0A8H8SSV8_9AGAM|nr:Lipase (class 3) [Rhizoctonia solani]QRW16974.1 Lipase (class 3) [Rhizoctonia solani]